MDWLFILLLSVALGVVLVMWDAKSWDAGAVHWPDSGSVFHEPAAKLSALPPGTGQTNRPEHLIRTESWQMRAQARAL